MSALRLLPLCIAVFSLATVVAQRPTDAILPAENAVLVGGGKVALGDDKAGVLRRLGPPLSDIRGQLTYPNSVWIKIGPDDRVYSIEFTRFQGKTPGGVGTGSTVSDALVEFPALANVKNGWNTIGKMSFLTPSNNGLAGTITAIKFETIPGPAPVVRRDPTPPPRDREGDGRGGGDRDRDGGRDGGQRGDRGGRGGAGLTDDRGRNGPDEVVVWSRTWQTDGRRWISAPVSGWPTDRGILLVRVDHDDLVSGCNHRFFGRHVAPLGRGDHVFAADIVGSHRRGLRAEPSWDWFFAGSGQVKVEIRWFDDRRRLDAYCVRNTYDEFRIPRVPRRRPAIDPLLGRYDRLAGDVRLVWEKTWRTRENYGWVTGPDESWPRDSGVLLLRVAAARGVNAFFYRVGARKEPIGFGDHLLPVDILPRGGLILDKDDRSLRFAAAGEGLVRVELYWVPDRAICDRWCREHPFALDGRGVPIPLPPDPVEPRGAPSNPIEALAWLFGDAAWRSRSDFEQDWSRHGFEDVSGATNVASPRNGALVTHSSRDDIASRGYGTDGGLWYSRPSRHAWIYARFYCPSSIDRIDIATAGSSNRAARYIIVELQRQDGLWVRAAGFQRENINWYRTGGGPVVSRPPVSIPVDRREAYVAVRVLFAGAGPFRLGGLSVLGRFIGEPIYVEDDFAPGSPAGSVVVEARRGWVDTGCDIRAGAAFYVDVEGSWSVEPARRDLWPPCGPDGIDPGVFAAANGTIRRRISAALPAPGLPFGALIGRVGDGPAFAVLPGRPTIVRRSGRLWLRCNDPWPEDDVGALICTIVGGVFTTPLEPESDDVVIGFEGTLRDDRSRRPIQGADVIVQLEASPRTVFGGGRTDAQGRYRFEVVLPRGAAVVVRVPEYKTESVPASFAADGPHRWEGWIR